MYNNQSALWSYEQHCKLIVGCDLNADTFTVIHRGAENIMTEQVGTASELFRLPFTSGILYEEDSMDYLRYTDIQYIKNLFDKHGSQADHWVRYRERVGDQLVWIRLEFVPNQMYSPDNRIVYAVYKDIQTPMVESGLLMEEVLRVLSADYENVYYVDFDANEVYPYRARSDSKSHGRLEALNGESYESVIASMISELVVDADQQEMHSVLSRKNLAKILKTNQTFYHSFRLKMGEGQSHYRMKISNMDGAGELHRAVFGFFNIDAEAGAERPFYGTGDMILIVGNDDPNRKTLVSILEDEYQVLVAKNGEEAMGMLNEHRSDIALVLTDLLMPECGGLELLRRMRAMQRFESVPVIITTHLNSVETEVECLRLGASDFVNKPYSPQVVLNRIRSLIRLRASTAMLNVIERDPMTGMYTKEAFYRYAQHQLDIHPGQRYTVVVSDIENFKMINDRYGRDVGDATLKYLTESKVKYNGDLVICGRIAGDIFAWLRPTVELNEPALRSAVERIQKQAPVKGLVLKYGYFDTEGDNSALTIQQMCDRALLAVRSIKGKYGRMLAKYDERMHLELVEAQHILNNMENALAEKQFQVYYQPKMDLETGRFGGAEALVRWVHPEFGFMNPGQFVPLFEQNGFITRLDEYVWQQVCADILHWQEQGLEVAPISVNLSRRDFEDEGLAERLLAYTNAMGVPHECLHAEVTESAFVEHPKALTEAVRTLRESGIRIELDDFGTGYSSLNALNSLEMDVLKIDMSIVRQDTPDSDRSVLEFCIRLAKMLGMKTVAEGVEFQEQVERLRSLGCDYIQGYYYSRPLKAADCAEYLKA